MSCNCTVLTSLLRPKRTSRFSWPLPPRNASLLSSPLPPSLSNLNPSKPTQPQPDPDSRYAPKRFEPTLAPKSAISTILHLIISFCLRCYSKERSGYKYYSTVVRDVVSVSSLSQCASRCGSEVFCNSFSFRFSNLNDQDNCLLSGLIEH